MRLIILFKIVVALPVWIESDNAISNWESISISDLSNPFAPSGVFNWLPKLFNWAPSSVLVSTASPKLNDFSSSEDSSCYFIGSE